MLASELLKDFRSYQVPDEDLRVDRILVWQLLLIFMMHINRHGKRLVVDIDDNKLREMLNDMDES